MASDNKLHIKHIEIYIIAFVAMIVIAGFAFAYACKNMDALDPGYYQIDYVTNKEVVGYGNDFTYYAYLDGESKEISERKDLYKEKYSSALLPLYAGLDDENVYPSFVSIARLNENVNQEVELNEFVYSTLKDAYNKTLTSNNYSVFAAPMYDFWAMQFGLSKQEQISNDPLNNEESKKYLTELASYINDQNHVNLEFLEGNKVILHVSEVYLNYLKVNEVETSIVSLNVLRRAYLLTALSEELDRININTGFIYTDDGLVSQLSRCPTEEEYAIYKLREGSTTKVGNIKSNKPNSLSTFRRYKMNASAVPHYYEFEYEGTKIYRSDYIDIDLGYSNNFYLSTYIYRNDVNLVDSCFYNNELVIYNSIEEIKDYLSSHSIGDLMLVVDVNKDDKIIYITESIKNYISLSKELDYNLHII